MGITVSFHGEKFDKKGSQNRLDTALYNVTNQAAADMDQFVPFKSGYLSNTGNVMENHISWQAPYARAQFYGIINGSPVVNYTRNQHPLATKRWDLKAKSLYMNSWKRAFVAGWEEGGINKWT